MVVCGGRVQDRVRKRLLQASGPPRKSVGDILEGQDRLSIDVMPSRKHQCGRTYVKFKFTRCNLSSIWKTVFSTLQLFLCYGIATHFVEIFITMAGKMEPPADRPYKKHLDEAASHQTNDYREPSAVQKAVEKGERDSLTVELITGDKWLY